MGRILLKNVEHIALMRYAVFPEKLLYLRFIVFNILHVFTFKCVVIFTVPIASQGIFPHNVPKKMAGLSHRRQHFYNYLLAKCDHCQFEYHLRIHSTARGTGGIDKLFGIVDTMSGSQSWLFLFNFGVYDFDFQFWFGISVGMYFAWTCDLWMLVSVCAIKIYIVNIYVVYWSR